MFSDDVAIVTYTTSKYADVWPVYFGQLAKHCKLKSYVLSDRGSGEKFDFGANVLIEHDDDAPYYEQYLDALDVVKEPFVVYHQEDFLLYADVDLEALERYAKFLRASWSSYVRLIRCGYSTPLDKPLAARWQDLAHDLYEVDMSTNDAFSMQATLWDKAHLKKLYDHVKSVKWLEGDHWNRGCRDVGIKGAFCYNGEKKRGKFHYDSTVWAYTCTAINRGKWNTVEYNDVMPRLFAEYDIDPSIRGVRTW